MLKILLMNKRFGFQFRLKVHYSSMKMNHAKMDWKRVMCFVLSFFVCFVLVASSVGSKTRAEEGEEIEFRKLEPEVVELIWGNCRQELINAKDGVKELELFVPEEQCGNEIRSKCRSQNNVDVEKVLNLCDHQIQQTILHCLKEKNLMFLLFREEMSTRRETPQRCEMNQGLGITASLATPSSTSIVQNFDPNYSQVKPTTVRSLSESQNPPRRNAQEQPAKDDSMTKLIGLLVVLVIIISLLLCLCNAFNNSSNGKKDDKPLLSVTLSDYSSGSSSSYYNKKNDDQGFGSASMNKEGGDNFYKSYSNARSEVAVEVDQGSDEIGLPTVVSGPVGLTAQLSLKPPPGLALKNPPGSALKPPPGSALKPPPGRPGKQPSRRVVSLSPSPSQSPPPGFSDEAQQPPRSPGVQPPPRSPGVSDASQPQTPKTPPPQPTKASAPPPGGKNGPPPPPPGGKSGPPPPPPPRGRGGPPPPPMGSRPRSGPARPGQKAASGGDADDGGGDAKTKLKPFFWDKVPTNPDDTMVWNHIKAGSFQFNEEMIETLFGCAPVEKGPAKKPSKPMDHTNDSIQLIEVKKAQNLAILLKALNVTTEEVTDALEEGNELPSGLLSTLLKMAPTPEEELKLRLFDGDLSKLGTAERFLRVVIHIPFAFMRMEALLFMCTLHEEESFVKESFATLEAACTQLRKNRLFLKLLEAVLKTGNRMNDGTFRGGAQAFKLDTLLKLSDVKGKDGKTTLLHFVVQEIIRTEGIRVFKAKRESRSFNSIKSEDLAEESLENSEDYYRELGLEVVLNIAKDLVSVQKAAILDSDGLTGTVAKFGHSLVKTKNFLNSEMKDVEEDNGFKRSLKGFLEEAEVGIRQMLEEEKRIMALVKSTADYFHGTAGKEEGLRIFVIVRDFLVLLDKVCREVAVATKKTFRPVKRQDSAKSSKSRAPTSDPRQKLGPKITERRQDSSSSDEDT